AFLRVTLAVERTPQRTMLQCAPVTVGLRPDNLAISGQDPNLNLTADFSENLGCHSQVHATAPYAPQIAILASGRPAIVRGGGLQVGLASGRVYLFDADGVAI